MSIDDDDSPVSWHSECFEDLLYRILEEEVFVFNPHTGHTHILNQLSWELVTACANRPRSLAWLFELITKQRNQPDDPTLASSLTDHLEQLQQLDLVHAETTSCN